MQNKRVHRKESQAKKGERGGSCVETTFRQGKKKNLQGLSGPSLVSAPIVPAPRRAAANRQQHGNEENHVTVKAEMKEKQPKKTLHTKQEHDETQLYRPT
jgi:hypothetical protein